MAVQDDINQIAAALASSAAVLATVSIPAAPDLTGLRDAANAVTDAVNKIVAATTTPVV